MCAPSGLHELRGSACRSAIVYVVGSVSKADTIAALRIRHGTQKPQCSGERLCQRAFVNDEHDMVSTTCLFNSGALRQPESISPFVRKRYGFSKLAAIPSCPRRACQRVHIKGMCRSCAPGADAQGVEWHVQRDEAVFRDIDGRRPVDPTGSKRGECEEQERSAPGGRLGSHLVAKVIAAEPNAGAYVPRLQVAVCRT